MSIVNALADGFAGLGLGGNAPVYAGFGVAKKPPSYTTLVPTGGLPSTWPGGEVLMLTLQVNSYGPAESFNQLYDRALAAHAALHERCGWPLDGYRVERVQCLQPPFPNGVEGTTLCVTFNCLLWLRATE